MRFIQNSSANEWGDVVWWRCIFDSSRHWIIALNEEAFNKYFRAQIVWDDALKGISPYLSCIVSLLCEWKLLSELRDTLDAIIEPGLGIYETLARCIALKPSDWWLLPEIEQTTTMSEQKIWKIFKHVFHSTQFQVHLRRQQRQLMQTAWRLVSERKTVERCRERISLACEVANYGDGSCDW